MCMIRVTHRSGVDLSCTFIFVVRLDMSTFIFVVSTVTQVTLTSMDAALNLQVYWRIEEIISWIQSFLPLRFLLLRYHYPCSELYLF